MWWNWEDPEEDSCWLELKLDPLKDQGHVVNQEVFRSNQHGKRWKKADDVLGFAVVIFFGWTYNQNQSDQTINSKYRAEDFDCEDYPFQLQ